MMLFLKSPFGKEKKTTTTTSNPNWTIVKPLSIKRLVFGKEQMVIKTSWPLEKSSVHGDLMTILSTETQFSDL